MPREIVHALRMSLKDRRSEAAAGSYKFPRVARSCRALPQSCLNCSRLFAVLGLHGHRLRSVPPWVRHRLPRRGGLDLRLKLRGTRIRRKCRIARGAWSDPSQPGHFGGGRRDQRGICCRLQRSLGPTRAASICVRDVGGRIWPRELLRLHLPRRNHQRRGQRAHEGGPSSGARFKGR